MKKQPKASAAEQAAPSAKGTNAEAARIWLHIRDAGGWWSAFEVYEHWRPTFELGEVESMLRYLYGIGTLERRLNITAGAYTYGVTNKCAALPSYSLEPGTC